MPINIPVSLPATEILEQENVFVMNEERAAHQDIRPLKIAILNLMPKKIDTETQLLRLLSNSPLQVDIELIKTATHESTHTSQEHLLKFYKTFNEVKNEKFDGLVITGAPIEHLKFEEVDYWNELVEIMEWSKTNVFSTIHICWGAQAALYYHYGIDKYALGEKLFGVFKHNVVVPRHMLVRGFDSYYMAPHSRYTAIKEDKIAECDDLIVLSNSEEAGSNIIVSKDNRRIFVTSHSEYDRETLNAEYTRDIQKGLDIKVPKNYFPENNPKNIPDFSWRSHGHLLFSNWMNYFLYQATPYDLSEF